MLIKSKLDIIVLDLLIIVICLFLFRTSVPFFKYPFLVIYGLTTIYILIKYNKYLISTFVNFSRNYFWVLLSFGILILSFLFSPKLYLIVFKDVLNTLIILFIFFLLTLKIKNSKSLNLFNDKFFIYVILFSIMICLKDFIVIYDSLNASTFLSIQILHSLGSNLDSYYTDYNFSLLPILFSMIIIIYQWSTNENIKPKTKTFTTFLMLVYSADVLISNSRRGLIIYLVIVLFLALSNTIPKKIFFKKNSFINFIKYNSRPFLISLIILLLINYVFISFASFDQKNKILNIIGFDTSLQTKINISSMFYRYATIINKTINFEDFNEDLWSIKDNPDTPEIPKGFDPYNPDSGWGYRIHTTVETKFGDNYQILPKGAKGYFLDSTTNVNYWKGSTYSQTRLTKFVVNPGNTVLFSSYCYVSKDFNGTYACVYLSGENTALIELKYDNREKGSWQLLSLKHDIALADTIGCYLFWTKYYKPEYDSLDINGFVVFAYPQIELIENKDSILSYFITPKIKYNHDSLKNDFTQLGNNVELDKFNKNDTKTKELFHKNIDFDVTKLSEFKVSVDLKFLNSGSYSRACFINFPITFYITVKTINDPDLIRTWVSEFISEDTTYYGYKVNIDIDTITNGFIGSRTERWQFAWQILTKEYSWRKKIFGGGFAYLNWYGYYFYGDKTKSDWPHNPFISVLLYSGIIGLSIYLFFLYKVFYYYLKYIRKYYILFMFFLVTFFYSFFSANNPFDPPIMGFFVVLPFFIHYIEQKKLNNNKRS